MNAPRLFCGKRPVRGPLHLLRRNENGLTFSLGYLFAEDRDLLRVVLDSIGVRIGNPSSEIRISLQERSKLGITDIKISRGRDVAVTLEAKIGGWPARGQLARYALDLKRNYATRQKAVVALGVPPLPPKLARITQLHGIQLRYLRWIDILGFVGQAKRFRRPTERTNLEELETLIQEVVAMQAYDREVLIRDMNAGHHSYKSYFDNNLYICQAQERAEPLFFAPCFTGSKCRIHNGIHYFSRVYFRSTVTLHDKDAARNALTDAEKAIQERIERLRRRNRRITRGQIQYLETLLGKWQSGLRVARRRRDVKPHVVFFLGNPMSIPNPLKKHGGMVSIGFSLTLEQLMSKDRESATFGC